MNSGGASGAVGHVAVTPIRLPAPPERRGGGVPGSELRGRLAVLGADEPLDGDFVDGVGHEPCRRMTGPSLLGATGLLDSARDCRQH